MSDKVEVSTQAELDALDPNDIAVVRKGHFTVAGARRVEAWGSSSVVARESSRVVARESSRVVAWESSSVEAWESSRVEAWGSSSVEATPFVAVHKHTCRWDSPSIKGGVVIEVPDTDTCDAPTWLRFYGVEIDTGYAVLFKAVGDNWQTDRGPQWTYAPGATVTAPDYNARHECGGGLHLCASPAQSSRYYSSATRYVAVKVAVEGLISVGDKVKVRSCEVLYEVTRDGARVAETAVAS